jgi:teichuronic acid biosynthesis glycosyltransferase TuaG
MGKNSLVSVVIATYRRSSLLSQTLNSIINQTYQNLEIIIVDDGSHDSTTNTVLSVADNRIKFFSIPHSGRPAVPRNYGISKATGEYIAFCDDDDLWDSEKLQKQIDCFNLNPNIALIYTDYIIFSDNGYVSQSTNLHTNVEKQLYDNKVAFSSAIVRANVIKKIGNFDERMILKASEDYLFFTKLMASFPYFYLELPLMRYRTHATGISQIEGSISKKIKYFIRIYICIDEICGKYKIPFWKKVFALSYHLKVISKQILYPLYKKCQIFMRGKNV